MTFESFQLLCPKCRTELPWTETNPLTCSNCSTMYRVEDGIPIIRDNHDYYHELLPKERMHELLLRSRETSWQTALAEQIAKAPERNRPALHTVFADESRAAFKAILPPLDDRRVLDLGCGSGITSVGLARWAREVVACDLTFERVAFLALRLRQMGFSNVRAICAGDTRPLPFTDASFDCVILNGVLEWSAAQGQRPVRTGQLEFLREIRRILKPDGHLYIGIENRYGYGYFFGTPEDHTGVKYAALAPRWLADVLVKRANGHSYRTYTYSYRGLRKLLEEAGFASTRFFAPIPDYRNFREIYALDIPTTNVGKSTDGWRRRIKNKLERSRWFTPSFAIVTSPEKVRMGWIEELANELLSRHSIRSDNRFPRIRLSATSTAGLIIMLGREAIARVPLDPVNEVRVQRNFEGLQRAQAIAAVSNGFMVPRPLVSETLHGAPYTVETFVEGTPYTNLSDADKARGDRQAFDLLVELKSLHTTQSLPPPSKSVIWRNEVVERLRAIIRQLPDAETRSHAARLLELAQEAETNELPLAFTHGDFWCGNILFNGKNGLLALIDWDRWSEHDLATHDFLHYVCYRRVARTGCKWPDALCNWLDGIAADPIEAEGTQRFADRLELRTDWMPLAGLAYWVREVTGHHASKLELDRSWVRHVVDAPLPTLVRRVSAVVQSGH